MSISFELAEELGDVVDMVKKLAREEIRPHLRDFEREGGLPEALLQQVHALGLSTLALPQEVGGPGLDLRAAAVLQEELAWGDAGAACALAGPGAAALAVAALGDAEQRKRLLEPFARDDAFARRGALAVVEGPFGLSPDGIGTVAERAGDDWILRGEKRYVQDAGAAELTLVLAREAGGPDGWGGLAFFAVEGRPQGLRAGERLRTLGLETCRFAHLTLDSVRVPGRNRLAGKGDRRRDVLEIVARKRVLDAARLVGCCRAASDYANKYATERRAFGKALYEHQALAFMMADMATKLEACRWLAWRAAWRLDLQGGSDEALEEAAIAFKHATDLSVEVTTDAVQVLGGHGYIQDHPVEKWMRDARCLGLVDGLSVDADTQIAEQVLA
jgi:acyl-CoA dehydrogenase